MSGVNVEGLAAMFCDGPPTCDHSKTETPTCRIWAKVIAENDWVSRVRGGALKYDWRFIIPQAIAATEAAAETIRRLGDEIDEAKRIAWDEGYARGVLDEVGDIERADNPYGGAAMTRPWTATEARHDVDDLAAELAADMADEARTAQGDYDDDRPTLAEVDRDEWAARDE